MSYHRFSYVYDRLMEDMPYPAWIQFTQQCWMKYGQPKNLVELGCGTGNITIPLAEQGLDVTGIDLSEDMLAVAQLKLEQLRAKSSSPAVTLLQQDMREWELPQETDCVISFCDSLNYLHEEQDIIQVFARTYKGLKQGGLFLFDVHTIRQLQNYAEEAPFYLDEEDIAYIWTCDWNENKKEIHHHLTIFAENPMYDELGSKSQGCFERMEEVHVQRAYPLAWLKEQLFQAGFKEVDVYADFVFKSVAEYTERAFFVAQKG